MMAMHCEESPWRPPTGVFNSEATRILPSGVSGAEVTSWPISATVKTSPSVESSSGRRSSATFSYTPRSLDVAWVCPQLDPVKEHLNWIKRMLGADGNESPKEENADVLRRMAGDGDNLTKIRYIDFHHLFAREEDAVAFEETARNEGYRADHDFWSEQNAWLTTVHIRMVPTLDEITAMELALDGIARSFKGEPDGWGCMEVDETQAR